MNHGQQLTSTQMQHNSDIGYSSSGGGSEWRREEHGRFMQALELYGSRQTGDEWKHITDFVGSRTMEEVRLHGRQYLQRLVQQLPPSPMTAPLKGYLPSACRQNDSNSQNYQVLRNVDSEKLSGDTGKRAGFQQGDPISGTSALSAAAFDCALSMEILAPVQFHNQPLQPLRQQDQTVIVTPRPNGRTFKAWTFQEEKAFETALAGWTGSKSYPWTTIAATVPGRTAKDVRNRFDEMVGEIAYIEAGEIIPVLESSTSTSVSSNSLVVRQLGRSTLSRRAVPPPPIEVLPRSVGKDEAAGVFLSSRGSASGITMLSPTFLDMLANEAESEEKSPLLLPFSGLTNLPSPLFSPTLLPASSFCSRGEKEAAARGKKLLNADSDDVKMEDPTTPTAATAHSSSTPRILNDFLAGDSKFDDPLGTTPIHRRKPLRFLKSAIFGQESSTTKTEGGAGKLDVEMTDASAA